MVLSMEYGDFKLHKSDAFELDQMIAIKNPQNLIRETFWWESTLKIFSFNNYPLYGILLIHNK